MKYLTIEEVLYLHYKIIEEFGGLHGVRDEKRLQSLVGAPAHEVFGQEQYKSVHQRAAVYLRNLIGDHPFLDGNKRTAITVAAIFLDRNGRTLQAAPGELEDFAVEVATSRLEIDKIAEWFKVHTV